MYRKTRESGASWHRAFLFAGLNVLLALVLFARSEHPLARQYGAELGLAGAGLLVLATVVYVLAPFVWASEMARAQAAYGSFRDVLANFIAAIVLGNLVFLPLLLGVMAIPAVIANGLRETIPEVLAQVSRLDPFIIFLALVGLDLGLLVVIYARGLRTGATTEREMGITRVRFWRNLGWGVVGMAAIFAASITIALALSQLGVEQTQAEELSLARATPATFLLIFLAGTVLAPVAEEIFFRGYVFRAFLTSRGAPWAYVLSAGIFAIAHMNLPGLLSFFAIGIILAYLFQRSGSLVPCIVAHSLNNATALLAFYLLMGG